MELREASQATDRRAQRPQNLTGIFVHKRSSVVLAAIVQIPQPVQHRGQHHDPRPAPTITAQRDHHRHAGKRAEPLAPAGQRENERRARQTVATAVSRATANNATIPATAASTTPTWTATATSNHPLPA